MSANTGYEVNCILKRIVIMSPVTKAHSFAFALATTCVYTIWLKLAIIQTDQWIINFVITVTLSISFYQAIFKLFLRLCQKIRFLRKYILGRLYIEGLWIGYCIVDDEVEYYYEVVEQDLESISIKGRAFGKDHTYIGDWCIVNPNFNIEDSRIAYYYEMDGAASGDITLGYSRAIIYWDKHNFAYKETGFAIDNFSPNKQHYLSVKINGIKNYNDWITQNFWAEVEKLHKSKL